MIGTFAGLFGVLAVAGAPSTTKSERVWLVIAASDPSPARIAKAAQGLTSKVSGGLILQTSDCGEKRNVFAWALEIATTPDAAKAALPRARATVKDAFVKACAVTPRSLLALRFPAVNSSVVNVPDTAVNWDDADRTSSVLQLPDGRDLIIDRFFTAAPDDPLEGKRERIILATGRERIVLSDNCAAPAAFADRGGQLALQCAREEAGDELLHGVLAFDASGKPRAEFAPCRKPRWLDANAIMCSEESVDAKGRLRLKPKRVVMRADQAPSQPAP